MNSPINDIFNKSCKPGIKKYKNISNEILIIDNFFDDFNLARSFFLNRDKWNCIPYQDHSQSGSDSFFPNWVAKCLLEDVIIDIYEKDQIINPNNFRASCNHSFLDEESFTWSLSHSNYFPHIDGILGNEYSDKICLVNLSQLETSTVFYKFNDKLCLDFNQAKNWFDYEKEIDKKLRKYLPQPWKQKDVKTFIDIHSKNLKNIFFKKIEYKPNQAIIYSGNILHRPNIEKKFTEDNQRIILRLSFLSKNML